MNSSPRTLITAWRAAADDLGIHIKVPFSLRLSTHVIEADLLVRDFGGVNGMLISANEDVFKDYGEEIIAAGYGYSVLCPPYESYNRELFVETLCDWSWSGDGDSPDWCLH